MTEIKVSPEFDRTRPRLFFHASRGRDIVETMPEIGLLADKPTLTPSLELALDFVDPGRGFLTFWYPNTQEVKNKNSKFVTPNIELDDDAKAKLRENIDKTDLDSLGKNQLNHLIEGAKTYLPASRLGAIAKADTYVVADLATILTDEEVKLWQLYTQNYQTLHGELKEVLDGTEVTFIDPTLSNTTLAADLIRTGVEHSLLNIGQRIKWGKRDNDKLALLEQKQLLGGIHFDDSVYERYRNMLLSAIERPIE